MAQRKSKLEIEAWPQLIEGLQGHIGWLGNDAADVAKFLIIEGLEQRRREKVELKRAEWLAQAPHR